MATPLKKKDLALLNEQLRELGLIQQDIDKARELGVKDIEVLEERCKEAREYCVRAKKVYFPSEG